MRLNKSTILRRDLRTPKKSRTVARIKVPLYHNTQKNFEPYHKANKFVKQIYKSFGKKCSIETIKTQRSSTPEPSPWNSSHYPTAMLSSNLQDKFKQLQFY